MRRETARKEARNTPKNRPNRKRRNFLPFALGILCAGLVGEGVYAALTSPRFAIHNVEIRGAGQVPEAEILKAASIPLKSNLFRLKGAPAARRIAQIPRIRHAEVHRRFPNRVLIRVDERKPVALLAAGLNYYLVDETGIPYARLQGSGVKLPVFRVEPAPAVRLGQPLKSRSFEVGMKSLFLVKASLADSGTLWVDPDLNLCLNRGDFSARLGQPDRLDRKLKLLKGLLNEKPTLMKTAQYVDLSAPDFPAYMPRETALASAAASASSRSAALSGDSATLPSHR